MRRGWATALFVMMAAGWAGSSVSRAAEKSGEALFVEYCCSCHQDGGNIINPQKTLRRISREANGIRKPKDIVQRMRNPGPGMSRFDRTMISDEDALKIADHILKTYN